jgi:hypothetical protein
VKKYWNNNSQQQKASGVMAAICFALVILIFICRPKAAENEFFTFLNVDSVSEVTLLKSTVLGIMEVKGRSIVLTTIPTATLTKSAEPYEILRERLTGTNKKWMRKD